MGCKTVESNLIYFRNNKTFTKDLWHVPERKLLIQVDLITTRYQVVCHFERIAMLYKDIAPIFTPVRSFNIHAAVTYSFLRYTVF